MPPHWNALALTIASALTFVVPAHAVDSPVVRVLTNVSRTVRTTRYAHAPRIDPSRGRYEWDCSAMARWILEHASPDAERAVEHERSTQRPLARDYYTFASRLRDGDAHAAWHRVGRLEDARPGDLIAWVFPPWIRVSITGHVAFVLARPVRVTGVSDRWRVRVADSTSVPHADDSRTRAGTSGFGTGVIEFRVDPSSGAPIAYLWNDRPGRGMLRTPITIARVVR